MRAISVVENVPRRGPRCARRVSWGRGTRIISRSRIVQVFVRGIQFRDGEEPLAHRPRGRRRCDINSPAVHLLVRDLLLSLASFPRISTTDLRGDRGSREFRPVSRICVNGPRRNRIPHSR
nr:R-LORF7 protein [Gallid alphaherpesvirus 3]QEY02295.1 R-LORF7 protein [Gallid alphaherpesvirus 3]